MWDQLDDKTFESVSKEGMEIPVADTTVEPPRYPDMPSPMEGIPPDVPKASPPKAIPPPLNFAAPPKEDVENLTAWEYLNVVWDFATQSTKLPWESSKPVPPTIASCYEHMKNLDNHYGSWLEAKLGYWESRSECLRKGNPNWRDKVPKGVAAVLPPRYHPDVHREMLQAAGDTGTIVNQITEGFHISKCNFATGHYDLLPSPSLGELNDVKKPSKVYE